MSVAAVGLEPVTATYNDIVTDQSMLDQEDFLELLIAQLTHQDPMEPMSNDQMVSQMTQFGSLEELSNISEQLEQMNSMQKLVDGSSMIGKAIFGIVADTGQSITGVVDGIVIEDGITLAHVLTSGTDPETGEIVSGEAFLSFDEILSVAAADQIAEEATEEETAEETETAV